MTNAKLKLAYQNVEKESGQVRFLAFLSYIYAIFLAWQAQFLTVSSFVFLGFHHVASPLSVACTFFQRGADVAAVAVLSAFIVDAFIFATSLISAIRCFSPSQASLNCPERIVQGGYLVFYSGQHALVALMEVLSLLRYRSALNNYTKTWEKVLKQLPSKEERKRAATEAREYTLSKALVVDRRLHLFAFVPTTFFWLFCSPLDNGWLAILCGSRVLRDGFGLWLSSKTKSGSMKQAKVFDVFSIVVACCYLLISVAAWLYSEQLADPSTISWEILLDAAHSAYTNPWEWSLDGLRHMTEASAEPFYLTFVFIETLLLANRYSPIRG